MNLHKAKGLEAKIVFLASPRGETDRPPTVHVNRRGRDALGHLLFMGRKGRYPGSRKIVAQPIGWKAFSEEEARFAAAEAERLLYVAATRACDMLVVSRYTGKIDLSPWAGLELGLQDARELDAPQMDRPGREVMADDADDLSRIVQDCRRRLEAARGRSYDQTTVTAETKGEDSRTAPVREGSAQLTGGKARRRGTATHAVLEQIALGAPREDLEILCRNALTQEEDDEPAGPEIEELKNHVTAVLDSDFWERAEKAGKRLVEVPFADVIEKNGLTTVLRGDIDLLFLEEDGWVVADYKTDSISEDGLPEAVDRYREQVHRYARAWSRITNERVKTCCLFFTSLKKEQDIGPPG